MNSPARIARPAAIVNHPGPGRAIMAIPAASRRKPPTTFAIRTARFIVSVDAAGCFVVPVPVTSEDISERVTVLISSGKIIRFPEDQEAS